MVAFIEHIEDPQARVGLSGLKCPGGLTSLEHPGSSRRHHSPFDALWRLRLASLLHIRETLGPTQWGCQGAAGVADGLYVSQRVRGKVLRPLSQQLLLPLLLADLRLGG